MLTQSIVVLTRETLGSNPDSFPYGENEYEHFYRMHFVNSSVGFIGGTNHAETISADVYKTTDGGETFTQVYSNGGAEEITDIFFINENYGWIVLDYDVVMRTVDGGENWSESN
ncbi:MAG: hypothetical protein U5K00_01155 [Melioribacteraceae bacterium]|nr:hypothetical protein [Melioribacteraceae bacterium]